jgi:hypothetical protein
MWEAYRIGLALGAGLGLGTLFAALLAPRRSRSFLVVIPAFAVAAALGYLIGGWYEALAAALASAAAFAIVGAVVAGTLRRGGTRGGTALLVGLAAIALIGLAFIPFVGYLEALALPALADRARRRRPERYAGLRSLARD